MRYRFPQTKHASALCWRRGCSRYSSDLLRARALSRLIPAQREHRIYRTQKWMACVREIEIICVPRSCPEVCRLAVGWGGRRWWGCPVWVCAPDSPSCLHTPRDMCTAPALSPYSVSACPLHTHTAVTFTTHQEIVKHTANWDEFSILTDQMMMMLHLWLSSTSERKKKFPFSKMAPSYLTFQYFSASRLK